MGNTQAFVFDAMRSAGHGPHATHHPPEGFEAAAALLTRFSRPGFSTPLTSFDPPASHASHKQKILIPA